MPAMLLSALVILLALLLFMAALLIFRAVLYGRVPAVDEPVETAPVDAAIIAEHLSVAIQAQTVSTAETAAPDARAFHQLARALERMYPRLHAELEREQVNDLSLLYTWQGANPELKPAMVCAHLDVVPFDPATAADWTHPPFEGVVADGFVWGRGALDLKCTVIALMEAVEALIRAGYRPERTLYLAFGHDEEVGGAQGARCIANLLARRGVRLSAVLDEGGFIVDGVVPGMRLPVGLVGVAEKGYALVELKVEGRPGHSALPPRHTAIGVLARAVARLENRPMPSRLSLAGLMFEEIGAFLPFSMRLALANPWLFGRALLRRMEANPSGAALVRTTQAVTMIHGGVKDNVLPAQAAAMVNMRLLPGDTREDALEHVRRAVDDPAVQVSLKEEVGWEAPPVSPLDAEPYQALCRTARQVFPEAVTAPYLVAGATDSRHYASLTPNVYRFSPLMLDAELLKTIHGVDERIPVENLARMVCFYQQLVKAWTENGEPEPAPAP